MKEIVKDNYGDDDVRLIRTVDSFFSKNDESSQMHCPNLRVDAGCGGRAAQLPNGRRCHAAACAVICGQGLYGLLSGGLYCDW